MRRLSAVSFVVLFSLFTSLGRSQTSSPVWFTLDAPEGSVITASAPITLRYGQVASTCAATVTYGPCNGVPIGTPTSESWTSPKTFSPSGSPNVSILTNNDTFGGDPLPGVYKTLQIQEQASPQIITVNGQNITVPALPNSGGSSSSAWFTLDAPEGSVITASAPITLRYGQVASTCAATVTYGPCNGVPIGTPTSESWTSPKTFSPSGSPNVSVLTNYDTFGGDPLPGVYKTLQIQEQASPQIITVNGQNITVPALPNSGGSSSSSTWFTLDAPEGSVITASAPITLRYGQVASTCAATVTYGPCNGVPIGTPTSESWTSPKTFSPSGSPNVSVLTNYDTFGGDPLPGVYKTLQIQEQASPQIITVNGQNITVPAIGDSTCQLTADHNVINFQTTTVGYTLSSSASLTSNCSSTINVSAVQISGPYSVSGVQTPFSIAPNQTRNYSVVFAPTSAGAANGTINFVNSANSGVSVTLYGTGAAAQQNSLSASPTSLSFGNLTINTSTSLTLTITNSSSTSTTISNITVSGTGYSLNGVSIPFTLPANRSRQLTVTFSPTTAGNAPGAIIITSSGSTLTVPLSGGGITSAPAHSVYLSWTASSSPQVGGYNVYRTTASGSGYILLNSLPITTTSYTDQAVSAGTTYYYVVTAISTSGVESSYSNQTSVTIPNP